MNQYGNARKLYGQLTGEMKLWIQAYANTYSNTGSMTPGVIDNVVDNMSIPRIEKLMKKLKTERYKPYPVKRIYRQKKNKNKRRPLGLPTYDDKLVQEVLRMQLSVIYEPIFLESSHGFRPNKSCHTAFKYIKNTFTGTKWFVEGDIKGCFDNINHDILLSLIREKVDDERYIKLIKKFLKAGYMEDWQYHKTFSGTPQGGILSPLLANIYLHELDKFVRNTAIGFKTERKVNRRYKTIYDKGYRLRQKLKVDNENEKLKAEIGKLKQLQQSMKSEIPRKRLNYCRYADDFIIGILGSKRDAEDVKALIAQFLDNKLKLELSMKKTKITYCREKPEFLSYEIGAVPTNVHGGKGRGNIKLYTPKYKFREWKKEFTENGKAIHLPQLVQVSDIEILFYYNYRLRGWYNYWQLTCNVCQMNETYWYAKLSFFKTMANKYKSTVQQMVNKYYDKTRKQIVVRLKVKDETRTYKMFKDYKQKLDAYEYPNLDSKVNIYYFSDGVEIKKRMLTGRCELCGRRIENPIGHHIKRMADVRNTDEYWKQVMKSKRRKSLMVCSKCNKKIHGDWR